MQNNDYKVANIELADWGRKEIKIAEKERISNLASIGLYGFKSCEDFLLSAHSQLKQEFGPAPPSRRRAPISCSSPKRRRW